MFVVLRLFFFSFLYSRIIVHYKLKSPCFKRINRFFYAPGGLYSHSLALYKLVPSSSCSLTAAIEDDLQLLLHACWD